MKHRTKLIRFDREYSQFSIVLTQQLVSPKPLPLVVNGLSGGAADAFCAEAVRDAVKTVGCASLFLVSDEKEGQALRDVLCNAGLSCLYFPYRDFLFDFIAASHDTERERLFVLSALLSGKLDAIITTPQASLQPTMPTEILSSLSVSLSEGGECDPGALEAHLSDMGYTRVETVESEGQFTRRGGIIDLFDRAQQPLRIEFFGDEIDRMGRFDPLSQRLTERVESAVILPAREVIITEQGEARMLSLLRAQLKKKLSPSADKALRAEMAALEGKTDLYSRDKYISLLYPNAPCLLDLLPPRGALFPVGSSELRERTEAVLRMMDETATSLVEEQLVIGKYAVYSRRYDTLEQEMKRRVTVYINRFSGVSSSLVCAGLFGFRCRRAAAYAENFKQLTQDLSDLLETGYRVLILCPHAASAEALQKALSEKDISAPMLDEDAELTEQTLPCGTVHIGIGESRGGYELISPHVALLDMGEDKAVTHRRLRIPRHKASAGERILSYNDLSPGDFVVHEVYGIGCFEGIEKITLDGVSHDSITIRYAGGDRLFVPADRLELISKYIGAGASDGTVKLSKMGSPEWQKAKSRAKGAAKALAKDLIALYAARMQKPGYAFPPDSALEREFEEAFEFEETDPQLTAACEIKEDMTRPVPMDRLLCGDVGFGKTEVALRAAFKAIAAGKQVALLVPTTILALQHYQTALSRMRSFPVTVDMISRFRTAGEQERILRKLQRGDIDLIIGTHMLLGKRVKFRDLGLLIVDEEQRFGVAQKEKLKQLAENVDVLTLTATPIPRTLHMAMSGIRDMSILDEAPQDRFPVQTYVAEHDDGLLFEAMNRELRRGGQVLYLHNRTETIVRVAAKIAKTLPQARVTWAHGQMEKDELEQIWQSLVRGEIDILVCTTIIETGVDLPNANTLIVEDADRMGLSQLHQLRGRVGRSGRRAYAFFTYRAGKTLSDVAAKRLEAIREFAEFGAGFRIAMRDLEIRGAGNLLGPEQHGNIESVGYDLYIRILSEAILEEQGKKPEPTFEASIDIRVDALIPTEYLPSPAHRMEMYKKISHIKNKQDERDILDEFCDRFGEPPVTVLRLLDIACLRALAAHCRIMRVEQHDAEIRFRCSKINLGAWSELFAETEGLRILPGAEPIVALRLKKGKEPAAQALSVLERYCVLHDEENQLKEEPKNA